MANDQISKVRERHNPRENQPIDKKLTNAIQAKINSYIKPCINGDRYRSIAKMGGGSISVDDMYTITKRYFFRQLY